MSGMQHPRGRDALAPAVPPLSLAASGSVLLGPVVSSALLKQRNQRRGIM